MTKYEEWRQFFRGGLQEGSQYWTPAYIRDLVQIDIAESLSAVATILEDLRGGEDAAVRGVALDGSESIGSAAC